MKILITLFLVMLCAYLWDHEQSRPEIPKYAKNHQEKITVRLSDGQKMLPARAYAKQEYVQLIMPDGRAIIMSWDKIDVIIYK